ESIAFAAARRSPDRPMVSLAAARLSPDRPTRRSPCMGFGLRVLACSVALACSFAGCGGAAPEPKAETTERARDIYKPGESLYNRMCECAACDPGACCQGAASDDPGATGACDGGAVAGAEGYDFSQSESCTLSVASCVSRCFRRVWRVRRDQSC